MSFNYCIGFETKKYTSLSKDKFYMKINANKDIHECICEVLIDKEQYVHPYFDIDQKVMSIKIDIEKIREKLMTDFNVEEKDIAVASDCRPGKTSFHLVICNIKIKRSELRKYITKNKKILETLHFDTQPYGNGMQKWKTLYSPKITNKPEDKESVGMLPIIENDNIARHFIQIDDNDLPIFETAFENKEEEKIEENVKTVNKVLKISKKEDAVLTFAQNMLINEFNDTTSVFHEYKNDNPFTLFFRRTCESTCCWGKKHSMNGFLLKYNKEVNPVFVVLCK